MIHNSSLLSTQLKYVAYTCTSRSSSTAEERLGLAMTKQQQQQRRRLGCVFGHLAGAPTHQLGPSARPSSAAAAAGLLAKGPSSFLQNLCEGGGGGLSVGLAQNGRAEQHGFGSFASIAVPGQQQAAAADTIFLVASLTKPMTAVAVMQLVEQGRLSLDAPLHSVLPAFTAEGIGPNGEPHRWRFRKVITIRHLLTHTSGLPDAFPENLELRQRQAPLSEFTAATVAAPSLCAFEAGTNISYQSVGVNLLGEVVHR